MSGTEVTQPNQRKRFFSRRNVMLIFATFTLAAIAYQPVRQLGTLGDVTIYQRYAKALLTQPPAFPTEYPPPAALLFLLPRVLGAHQYLATFNLLAALALAATVLVVDRFTRQGFWLLALFALGTWAVVFTRYDIFVGLLTVLGFAAATRQRWILAQTLLAIAAGLKLYPLFLMPLVALWQWRSDRRMPLSALASAAILLLVIGGASWLVAAPALQHVVQYHGQRPFEFASLGASWLWLTGPVRVALSHGCWGIEPSPPFLLTGASILTFFLPATVYFAFGRGQLQPAAAWALVLLALLSAAKVFSPQYLVWVLPFVVLAEESTRDEARLSRNCYRAIWVGICVLTSLIYPFAAERIFSIIGSDSDRDNVMLLVTLRNLLWVVALLWAAVRWTRRKNPAAIENGRAYS